MQESQARLPFRPLTAQEVVDKLNAVPLFSVVNSDEQMFETVGGAAGDLRGFRFFLELDEAKESLAAVQAANPRWSSRSARRRSAPSSR